MFAFLPKLIDNFFPHLAKYAAHRRETRYAEYAARRRRQRYVRPRLEGLEERIVLDAYSFVNPVTGLPSIGSYTVGANWTDNSNALKNGTVPTSDDTADIPVGAACTVVAGANVTIAVLTIEGTFTDQGTLTNVATIEYLFGNTVIKTGGSMTISDGGTLNTTGLGVAGTLNDESTVNVTTTSVSGTGTTTVSPGGIVTIGSSDDAQADAALNTNTLTDSGTVNDGSPNGGGSSGTIDAVFVNLTNRGTTAVLNIGDPGTGTNGDMDVTDSMTVDGFSHLNVGGAGGSGGNLDVNTLISDSSSSPNIVVNSGGEIDVVYATDLAGSTTVTGIIKGEQGANVVVNGPGSVSGGAKLIAEINASFTFGPTSTWVIGHDNALGTALNEGKFYVDGALTLDDLIDPFGELTVNNDGDQTTDGSLIGSGGLDLTHDFTWNGGTIGLAAGVTTTAQGDTKMAGADEKILTATMTNIGNTTDYGGTGALWLMAGAHLINEAGAAFPLDIGLSSIFGPGIFENIGAASVTGTNGLTIAAQLDEEGDIDCAAGVGPLTLSDTSGNSILNGKFILNNDSLLISGRYTTTAGFEEDWSPSDVTTLTGTLTVAGDASAEFDHMVLASNGGSGGIINGAGEFSIGKDGLDTGDYLNWTEGTISTASTIIGPYATLNLTGLGMLNSGDFDNHGLVNWVTGAEIGINSATVIHNEKDGTFDFADTYGGMMPTFDNDGILELGAGTEPVINTFTQSSTGTLESKIGSASSWGELKVTGSATLDGTLEGSPQNGYQPPSGTSFAVLSGPSSGHFATVDPAGWSAEYNPGEVDLIAG